MNAVLLQQLTPAGPLLPATIHTKPIETQDESSTAAAAHPSRTYTASNNIHREPTETQATGSQLRHKLNPVLLQQHTPAEPLLPATMHTEPTKTQATGNQLGHNLNPVLLQQCTPAGPLLPATIHRQPNGTQSESSTAAATQPSKTSTASNNTHETN